MKVMDAIKEKALKLNPRERLALTDKDGSIMGLYRDADGDWFVYSEEATDSAGETAEDAWLVLEMWIEDDLQPDYINLDFVVEPYRED